MEKKQSKYHTSLVGKALVELTHRQWYWWALDFQRKVPPSLVATATIKQTCVCKHCDHKHTRKVTVKIHGDHERAIDVAKILFFIGRPGIKPEDIKEVEVKTPDCLWTPIYREKDGSIQIGITMRHGTIQELLDVGFLHTSGGKEKAA